ncbi:MAG TPA: hypothetical protein VMU06_12870 [Stellaceae bacterium]|nr:hypothetical protein [Stellaceae bacterium]
MQKSRNTRRGTSPYTGGLAKPLTTPEYLLGESEKRRAEIAYKIELAFRHYGIEPATPTAWQDLAMALLRQHCPGFRSETRGRKETVWTPRARKQLYRDVLQKTASGMGAEEACEELTETRAWRRYQASTLKDIFEQERAANNRIEKAEEIARAHLRKMVVTIPARPANEPSEPSLLGGAGKPTKLRIRRDTGQPLTAPEIALLRKRLPLNRRRKIMGRGPGK